MGTHWWITLFSPINGYPTFILPYYIIPTGDPAGSWIGVGYKICTLPYPTATIVLSNLLG